MPIWSKNLPSTSRFTILTGFNKEAVMDNNTGLVWERAPSANSQVWPQAGGYCINKNIGGTWGWRLPTVVELKSVLDPALPPPFVSTSVFTGVQSAIYWSATVLQDDPASAWGVFLGNGGAGNFQKADTHLLWCVRGPMQESVY